jgi:hypothetical protein
MDSINRLQSIWTGLTRNTQYSPYVEEEDVESFLRRSGSEGPEYFARGFTTLRTALLAGIRTGWFANSSILNFEFPGQVLGVYGLMDIGRFGLKRSTVLPRFLFRAWAAIFDEKTGMLRADYDTDAVSCLNQLLAVFGKISGIHTPESEERVLNAFIDVEFTLATTQIDYDQKIGRRKLSSIADQASKLVRRVLAGEDPREIRPSHGSGAAACGTPVRERYGVPRHVASIDAIWPQTEYYFASLTHVCDKLDEWYSSEDYVPCAKVLLVPKDAKGPRLISCEPKETMWIQQGLMAKLYTAIESHPLTRGSVNFTDQTPNQRAAKAGSIDSSLCTLDLSEASDRVRLDVVQRLFPENWAEALTAARSTSTVLPSGDVVWLSKHAPMGSACCFPVMALVIWSILAAALPPGSKILVYGDDIVVPNECYALSVRVLEALHLRVNTSKSYATGPFRESCGKEYIDGIDITPVRLRAFPHDDAESRARTIAFANNCSQKFGSEQSWLTYLIHDWYSGVAERQFRKFHNRVKMAHLPERANLGNKSVRSTYSQACADRISLAGVLDVAKPDNSHLRSRWHSTPDSPREGQNLSASYQRREYRILVPEPRRVKYDIDDWCHVLRALVNPKFESSLGVDALSKRVSYKYRWVTLGDLSSGVAEM